MTERRKTRRAIIPVVLIHTPTIPKQKVSKPGDLGHVEQVLIHEQAATDEHEILVGLLVEDDERAGPNII